MSSWNLRCVDVDVGCGQRIGGTAERLRSPRPLETKIVSSSSEVSARRERSGEPSAYGGRRDVAIVAGRRLCMPQREHPGPRAEEGDMNDVTNDENRCGLAEGTSSRRDLMRIRSCRGMPGRAEAAALTYRIRIHKTLRVTPAMEAGVTNHLWTIEDIAQLVP